MSEQQTQKVTEAKADTVKSAAAEGKEVETDGKEEIGKACCTLEPFYSLYKFRYRH